MDAAFAYSGGVCCAGFALFRHNNDEFLRRYTTADETWMHHNTPQTKLQHKQWVSASEPVPKNLKTEK